MDNTDRVLNKIISVLLFTVFLIMLTIGSIFIMPPSFAESSYNLSDYFILDTPTYANASFDGNTIVYYNTNGSLGSAQEIYLRPANNTFDGVSCSFDLTFDSFRGGSSMTNAMHFARPSSYCTVSNLVDCSLTSGYVNFSGGSNVAKQGSFSVSCTDMQTSGQTIITFYSSSTNTTTITIDNLIINGVPIGGETLTPSPATIIVRPGNVAYIGYDEGYCNLSVRLNNAVKSYSSNTRIGYSASRPSEGSSLYYDNSTGNSVSWSNSQPRDILGRSTYFIYHETLNSVGYFIIYNPAYDDAGNVNNAISAEFSSYTSVVQFPLTTSLVDGSTVSSGSSDEYYMSQGEDMMTTPGVPTYIYTGTDGTTSSAIEVPASQYNYYAPEENEEGLLAGFVQRIVNLLSAPVKHIQNLFNEGLTFMTWLSGLWSWLPAEVVGILTSALVVLIVVGVIKVFWK